LFSLVGGCSCRLRLSVWLFAAGIVVGVVPFWLLGGFSSISDRLSVGSVLVVTVGAWKVGCRGGRIFLLAIRAMGAVLCSGGRSRASFLCGHLSDTQFRDGVVYGTIIELHLGRWCIRTPSGIHGLQPQSECFDLPVLLFLEPGIHVTDILFPELRKLGEGLQLLLQTHSRWAGGRGGGSW